MTLLYVSVSVSGMATDPLRPRNVPQALRLLRSQAELSRDKAAALCGVEPRTLSRYESSSAQRIDVRTLRRLVVCYADYLELEPEALWGDIGRLIDEHTRQAQILDAQLEALRGDPERGEP